MTNSRHWHRCFCYLFIYLFILMTCMPLLWLGSRRNHYKKPPSNYHFSSLSLYLCIATLSVLQIQDTTFYNKTIDNHWILLSMNVTDGSASIIINRSNLACTQSIVCIHVMWQIKSVNSVICITIKYTIRIFNNRCFLVLYRKAQNTPAKDRNNNSPNSCKRIFEMQKKYMEMCEEGSSLPEKPLAPSVMCQKVKPG